jgi:NifU-like protein involved in Fe-S cluster formation
MTNRAVHSCLRWNDEMVQRRTVMNAPLYTTEILRLAASLPLEQRLAAPDGRGERRATTCGSRIVAEVELGPDGSVARFAQQVQACAFGQASAALVGRSVVGLTAAELRERRVRFANWLSGEGEAPAEFEVLAPARAKTGRHGAMLLPFDALIAAMEAADQRPSTSLRSARAERGSGGDSAS